MRTTTTTGSRAAAWLIAAVAVLGTSTAALAGGNSPLQRRLAAVRALVRGRPAGFDKHFDRSFLKAVPPNKLRTVFRDYFKKGGPIVTVREIARKGPHFAEYRFYSERGVFPVKLGVSAKRPHLITTLWFGVLSPSLRSLDQVVEALGKLPGKVSFALWQLGSKPGPIKELNPTTSLAIGSTFKLYILGALIDEVSKGRKRWDQTTRLRDGWKSWPSGKLHQWPAGAPVTLSTLAGLMISVSDNTATDHLLHLVGRGKVEAMLPRMGHAPDRRNEPFLSTREMFLLKTVGGERRLRRYLRSSVKKRREQLRKVIARLPRETFKDLEHSTPTAIDKVEWFASASDLCRAMSWIRDNTASEATRHGRALIAINRGMTWRDKYWKYVGYKGGSEPGVLNLTWLVNRRDGRWFALSAGWNNTERPLDEERLIAVLQSLIILLEK